MADDPEISYRSNPYAASSKVSPPSSLKRKAPDKRIANEPTAKRDLFTNWQLGSEEDILSEGEEDPFLETQATQHIDYTPNEKLTERPEDVFDMCLKCDDGTYHPLVNTRTTIGRSKQCHVQVGANIVSRQHAVLTIVDRSVSLEAVQSVWILVGSEWKEVKPGETVEPLLHGKRFCLAPPNEAKCPKGAKFSFHQNYIPANPNAVGSESFDYQYLRLLREIEEHGTHQTNKKGDNWTLGKGFQFDVSLRSQDPNESLIPITTLRKMHAGRKAIIEALWYIRGDKNIKFLQDNQCTFWDAQAREDGTVGLNYGLLTNWPNQNGTVTNQLEEEVIKPLVQGKKSRNMVCTLCKPDEDTVQVACTSSVQFGVTGDEELSLTVTQRSSDVILGLPHDVIAWSTILHLVRREVRRRSDRDLSAGSLHFNISACGAHVYTINEDSMNELLRRNPKLGVRASLSIKSDEGITELAKNFCGSSKSHLFISGYGGEHCYHPALKVAQATST